MPKNWLWAYGNRRAIAHINAESFLTVLGPQGRQGAQKASQGRPKDVQRRPKGVPRMICFRLRFESQWNLLETIAAPLW